MSTLTRGERQKITDYLAGRHIPAGLGTADEACSVAAINFALTGELTDTVPACMSPVVGRWVIVIQDAMPDSLRNSDGWRALLPAAAGTGRDRETERLAVLLDCLWGTSLPLVQSVADAGGWGDEWRSWAAERMPEASSSPTMTAASAVAASASVLTAWAVAASASAVAAWAAAASASAVEATPTWAAKWSSSSPSSASPPWPTSAAAEAASWSALDPVGTLRRLIEA